MSVVTGTLPVGPTIGGAGDLQFGASPSRGIAPSHLGVGLAAVASSPLTHANPSQLLRSEDKIGQPLDRKANKDQVHCPMLSWGVGALRS